MVLGNKTLKYKQRVQVVAGVRPCGGPSGFRGWANKTLKYKP